MQVSEIESRSALIQLTAPAVSPAEVEVEASEFLYELSLSEKHDGTYTVMYRLVCRNLQSHDNEFGLTNDINKFLSDHMCSINSKYACFTLVNQIWFFYWIA